VLSRVLGYGEDLASARNVNELWGHAEALLPGKASMRGYTQGLMDLGATVCLPRAPSCLLCPVQSACVAAQLGTPEAFPVKTRKLKRSAESLWLLDARSREGAVWLEKRPVPGVWAGLYCLPVFASREELADALPARTRLHDGEPFVHVLTHKDLHLHPVHASAHDLRREGGWFAKGEWPRLGLPAPVRKLLEAGVAPQPTTMGK
jgi:A/G-specific adenine glycosylase